VNLSSRKILSRDSKQSLSELALTLTLKKTKFPLQGLFLCQKNVNRHSRNRSLFSKTIPYHILFQKRMYFTPRTKLLPTLKFICIKEAPLRIRSIRSNRAIIEVLFPDRCRSIPKRTGQILTLPDRTIQLINAGALGFQLV